MLPHYPSNNDKEHKGDRYDDNYWSNKGPHKAIGRIQETPSVNMNSTKYMIIATLFIITCHLRIFIAIIVLSVFLLKRKPNGESEAQQVEQGETIACEGEC